MGKLRLPKVDFSVVTKVNCTLVAFCAFSVKMLVVQPTIADSLILLGLGAAHAYSQYLKRFQPYKLDDAVMKDLIEVKSALSTIKLAKAHQNLQEKKYF
jgi:hypothetical protein